MAKYFGKIGFSHTQESETSPGVWEEEIIERPYYGDVIQVSKKWQSGESLNDNVNISNEISIVADPIALNALDEIRYVWWNNVKWKVTNIRVAFPRLILSIGGVYNGKSN